MRKVAVFFADTHGGHKLGLLNPETEVPTARLEIRGGEAVSVPGTEHLIPGPMARDWLWPNYLTDIRDVIDFARGDPIIPAHNGDACQGDKYTDERVSSRRSDQIFIAEANMRPWFQIPNVEAFRFIEGTGAHDFGEGTAAHELVKLLKPQYPKVDIGETAHGLLTINGMTVDIAHHGPSTGGRNWLRGNIARYYLRSLMQDCINMGKRPPRLVVRSHYHEYIHERVEIDGKELYVSDIIITPSYCGLGCYARQATKSKHLLDNGMVAVEIIDGELGRLRPLRHRLDLRTREEL